MRTKEAFWTAVKACLIEFHDFSRLDATHRTLELQQTIFLHGNLTIYNEEPFSVACEIAGKTLSLEERSTRYEELLVETHWSKA